MQILGDVSAPNPLHDGIATNRYLKQEYYIGYAQDEWKIRPNVTMNYGLRYEYYSPLHEDQNLYTLYVAGTGTARPGTWYKSSKTNFGPRLALTLVAFEVEQQDGAPDWRRLLLWSGPDRRPGTADRFAIA